MIDRMKKYSILFLTAVLLCACRHVTAEPSETPQQTYIPSNRTEQTEENEEPDAEVPIISDIPVTETQEDKTDTPETEPTAPDFPETETAETESALPDTETCRTSEPPAETEPLAVYALPEDLHTNISEPKAAEILTEIYKTVSASAEAGVYFTDTEGEYWFGIGEENRYHTASTIKPVYCQYLLTTGTDLEAKAELRQVSRTSSSGKLTEKNIGTAFTVGELMEYTVRYSDNQAYRLLYETFGIEGYNGYVSSFGTGGLQIDEEWEWSMVTPRKLSRMMQEIYRFSQENSVLVEHMKNTTVNSQIPAGTGYETAHKYGSNGGTDGYHDTAIVYAPERAYILTVMTHIDTARIADADAVFRRTAELCDVLHSILFLEK